MSAQPKRQYHAPAETTAQPKVRIVPRSECSTMAMPKPVKPAAPSYDFVGIAG